MTDYLVEILKKTLEIPSPVGYCENVTTFISTELEKLGFVVSQQSDGAIRAKLSGCPSNSNPLIFMAHADTLGAQVKRIKPSGNLELVPLGSLPPRFAEGARAYVHIEGDEIRGTILPIMSSGHAFGAEVNTNEASWTKTEMRLDIPKNVLKDKHPVKIGDIVSLDPQTEFLENGYIVSRFLDDKAAIAALICAFKNLNSRGSVFTRDVEVIISVSEEIGTGASQFFKLDGGPDIIALDIGIVADGYSSSEEKIALCMGDASGPYNRNLSLWVESVCENAGIECNRDVFVNYFSDLTAIKRAGGDARMALLTFGVTASHGYERTHIKSLRSLVSAIEEIAIAPL